MMSGRDLDCFRLAPGSSRNARARRQRAGRGAAAGDGAERREGSSLRISPSKGPFVGVLITKALLRGVYIGVPEVLNSQYGLLASLNHGFPKLAPSHPLPKASGLSKGTAEVALLTPFRGPGQQLPSASRVLH